MRQGRALEEATQQARHRSVQDGPLQLPPQLWKPNEDASVACKVRARYRAIQLSPGTRDRQTATNQPGVAHCGRRKPPTSDDLNDDNHTFVFLAECDELLFQLI